MSKIYTLKFKRSLSWILSIFLTTTQFQLPSAFAENESRATETPLIRRDGANKIHLSFLRPLKNKTFQSSDIPPEQESSPENDEQVHLDIETFPSNNTASPNLKEIDPSKVIYMGHVLDSQKPDQAPQSEDFSSDLNSFQRFLLKHQKNTKITFMIVRASISATSAFAALGGGALLLPAIPALATYVSAMVDTNPNASHFGAESIIAGAMTAGIFSGALLAHNKTVNDWMAKDSLMRKIMKSVFIQTVFITTVRLAALGAHQAFHYLTTGGFDYLSVGNLLHELSIVFSGVASGFITQNFWSLWISEKQRQDELSIEQRNDFSEKRRQEAERLSSDKIDFFSCMNSVILNSVSLFVGSHLGGDGLKWMSYGIGGLGAMLWHRQMKANNRNFQNFICPQLFN